MASKFPLLEQMRAERQRAEDEIAAPYRQTIDGMHRLLVEAKATIRKLQEIFGSDVGRELISIIADGVAQKVRQHILQAAATSTSRATLTVHLPMDLIRFYDPRSVESEILRHYGRNTLPKLSANLDRMPPQYCKVVTIHIPELHYRHVQHEDSK